MSTSGAYSFNPSLGELILYAFNLCEIRQTSLTQQHIDSANMSANMILSRWSNQGVNLWAVDSQTIDLIAGQYIYSVPQNTVMILDAYCSVDGGSDRIIYPVSRSEYASYPNKQQQGIPTVYWFDRLIDPSRSNGSLGPSIYLWMVPDGQSSTQLTYYRVRQLQDSSILSGQTVEIPYLWLEAFAYALAARLSMIWNSVKAPMLKQAADESYAIAAEQNIEQAQQYITPQLSGYYR